MPRKQKTVKVKKQNKVAGYKAAENRNERWHQLESKWHLGGTIKVPVGVTDDALEEFVDDKNAEKEVVVIEGASYTAYSLKADEVEETEV